MTALRNWLLAVGAMAFILSGGGDAGATAPVHHTIETYGAASAYLPPDRISIDIDVEGRSTENPLGAYNQLAERLGEVKKALGRSGVDLASEVRTHGLHLHVRQENLRSTSGDRMRMPVHVARLSMEVARPINPDDAEAAPRFLRQVLAAGAAGFRSLTFTVDAEKRFSKEKELETRALADAARRADALAEAAGMVLGDAMSIALAPTARMSMGKAMVRAESGMPPSAAVAPDIAIHSGEGVLLTVTVQASYAMNHPPEPGETAGGGTR